MLSCEAALLYNVLAALGRYGEGRFGNGVLYDGSDPPVLQYNAAALIGLWLNVGQCVITALMQLMLQLSIHAIDPAASLPAFGHKAARKLRVMASVISAGDGVYSESAVGETSLLRCAADTVSPGEMARDYPRFLEMSGALPTTFCQWRSSLSSPAARRYFWRCQSCIARPSTAASLTTSTSSRVQETIIGESPSW